MVRVYLICLVVGLVWLVGLVVAWRLIQEMLLVRPVWQLHKQGDVEGLAAFLQNENLLLRIEAIKALQQIGDDRTAELLGTAAKGGEEPVSLVAVQALATIESDRAVEQLQSIFVVGKDDLRRELIKALPVEKSSDLLPNLINSLNDKDKTIRQEAAKKLVQLYHSGLLSPEQKKRLLHRQRDKITRPHRDEANPTHRDIHADHNHTDRPIEDCLHGKQAHQDIFPSNSHVDKPETHHIDWGIGVDFPL